MALVKLFLGFHLFKKNVTRPFNHVCLLLLFLFSLITESIVKIIFPSFLAFDSFLLFFRPTVLNAQVNKLDLLGGNDRRGLTLVDLRRMLVLVMKLGEVHALFTLQPAQAAAAAVIRLLVLLNSNSIATGAALAALVAVHAAAIAQQVAPIVLLFFLGAGKKERARRW